MTETSYLLKYNESYENKIRILLIDIYIFSMNTLNIWSFNSFDIRFFKVFI